MRILIINSAYYGSTGKISRYLNNYFNSLPNFESFFFYSRGKKTDEKNVIRFGNTFEIAFHVLFSRLFDNSGFMSFFSTKKLIRAIEKMSPDVILLQNLHGYYLNLKLLFNYFKKTNIKICWTLHDCWAFTGHCAYFNNVNCDKWISHCKSCKNKKNYPKSILFDNSFSNFNKKKTLFTGIDNLKIITPSFWLEELVKLSFLKSYPIITIHNGIDLSSFFKDDTPTKYVFPKDKHLVLGIAQKWEGRKGLDDFLQLASILGDKYHIILVGELEKEISFPHNVTHIQHTDNLDELRRLYSLSDVMVNLSYDDNYPTVILESLACGTPVITYMTGGCGEMVDSNYCVETGNIYCVKDKINNYISNRNYSFPDLKRISHLSMCKEYLDVLKN